MAVIRREVLALAGAALAFGAHAQPASPVATTRTGRVRGQVDRGIAAFKGIRYGTAERFRPPRPAPAWQGVADAAAYGPSSPQRNREPNQDEDCLVLNVWTPALDAERRPVMVYIHGGAYSNGSGSAALYDGVNLARRRDVVVVTLNHRLNAFGYAYLAPFVPELADSGNVGQLDLVLALRWVRENIAAFGGDPARVLVFGQSGGGAKIATLMAMPAAKGLFHRAATMSGQQVTASGPMNATRRTRAWLEALKLKPQDARQVLTLPVERLVEALGVEDPVLGFGGLYFGPVLDERSLTRHPFYPDAPAQSASIPMIIGNTHDETRAFLKDEPDLTWDALPSRLTFANLRVDVKAEAVIAEYRQLYPQLTPMEVLYAATTAGRSWRAAVIEAEERAKAGTPAWVYQLGSGGALKAGHTADIPLVFDNAPAGQRALAEAMSAAFAAFAKAGDPNTHEIPRWGRYDLKRRQTMVLDAPPRMEDDPRGAERRFFAKVPYVQPGT